MEQPNDLNPVVSDDEIVADLFRLARSGQFRQAAPLQEAGESMYPNEPKDRIHNCMRRLGEILWDADYCGYATEFKPHRRRPRRPSSANA